MLSNGTFCLTFTLAYKFKSSYLFPSFLQIGCNVIQCGAYYTQYKSMQLNMEAGIIFSVVAKGLL